jgi:hypothetical protein
MPPPDAPNNDEAVAGPSGTAQAENGDEPEQNPRGTRRKREEAVRFILSVEMPLNSSIQDGYGSDDLDEPEAEKAPAKKKRKLTKAQEAKLKAEAKAKAKKNKELDESEEEKEVDTYTAPSKSKWTDAKKPPAGSIENCAKCGKQFTVVSAVDIKLTNWRLTFPVGIHFTSKPWARMALPPLYQSFRHGSVQETRCSKKAKGSRRQTNCGAF